MKKPRRSVKKEIFFGMKIDVEQHNITPEEALQQELHRTIGGRKRVTKATSR